MTSKDFKEYIEKKHASKGGQSANQLTRNIIDWLNMNGFIAWRNNTIGIFDQKVAAKRLEGRKLTFKEIIKVLSSSYRKSHEKKGVSDILGIEKKTGRLIAVEVKVGKDKLSMHQELFLKQVNKSGGFGIVAKSFDDFLSQATK
jgi:hypothetical protein